MGKYQSGCRVEMNWKMVRVEAGKSMWKFVTTETMNSDGWLMEEQREADSSVSQ